MKPGYPTILVRILVAAHVAAITAWSLPRAPNAFLNGMAEPKGPDALLVANDRIVKPVIQPYVLASGIWQSWDMFAPNPASADLWCSAEVEMADGSIQTVEYPRMKNLSLPAKYFKERYRKFFERTSGDDYHLFWPAFAAQMAKRAKSDPSNPPVKVRLFRHWRMIKPPGQPQPTTYERYRFFELTL